MIYLDQSAPDLTPTDAVSGEVAKLRGMVGA
jgi:hypothetical protein